MIPQFIAWARGGSTKHLILTCAQQLLFAIASESYNPLDPSDNT
jgi:hypothetical protein